MMQVISRTVRRDFRERIAGAFPGLQNNMAYWRLLEYLLFSCWRDEETNELILPAMLVAAIAGKSRQHQHGHWNAIDLLDPFRHDVQAFALRAQDTLQETRARRVMGLTLPPQVVEWLRSELSAGAVGDERVYFATGKPYSKNQTTQERNAMRGYAQSLACQEAGDEANTQTGICDEARCLLDYLNGLASNRFAKILRHIDEAHGVVDELATDQDNQRKLLHTIREQPQPFYAPSPRSVRIYSVNDSFLRCGREIRKVLTQDWLSADLRSAQLAIVAQAWAGGIPSVAAFLASGKSIWRELCGWFGLDCTDTTKQPMKDALYAVIFGAGNKRLTTHFAKHFSDGRAALDRFRAHPLIHDIFRARYHQMRAVRRAGGATDAFGRWLTVEYVQPSHARYFAYDTVRSILALVAQSYELRLLFPVVQIAVQQRHCSNGFSITSWLHDGLTIDVHDRRDAAKWQKTLTVAVAAVADSLGIATGLDWTPDLCSES